MTITLANDNYYYDGSTNQYSEFKIVTIKNQSSESEFIINKAFLNNIDVNYNIYKKYESIDAYYMSEDINEALYGIINPGRSFTVNGWYKSSIETKLTVTIKGFNRSPSAENFATGSNMYWQYHNSWTFEVNLPVNINGGNFSEIFTTDKGIYELESFSMTNVEGIYSSDIEYKIHNLTFDDEQMLVVDDNNVTTIVGRGCDLSNINFSNVDLTNSDLRGCNLSNSDLTNTNLSNILVDQYTILPSDHHTEIEDETGNFLSLKSSIKETKGKNKLRYNKNKYYGYDMNNRKVGISKNLLNNNDLSHWSFKDIDLSNIDLRGSKLYNTKFTNVEFTNTYLPSKISSNTTFNKILINKNKIEYFLKINPHIGVYLHKEKQNDLNSEYKLFYR